MSSLPSLEEQKAQARRWAQLLRDAGYDVVHWWQSDDPADPFGDEWQVWDPKEDRWWMARIATIDIDGCGASWHGPDELWLKVIGPSENVDKAA